MGIFSRTRDIIAANFNDMLDKADDPQKMIRMIILEMEETLVEVRASAARTIADQKEMHRHTVKLDKLQADWNEKAQLAISKDREDLARAALVEKKKAADMSEQLKQEIAVLDDALRAYEQDIQKLQNRLREARSRQTAIAARLESAVAGTIITDIASRGQFNGSRLTFSSFSGKAGSGGTLSGSGYVDYGGLFASPSQGVAVEIRANAKNAQLVNRDDFGATVTGPLQPGISLDPSSRCTSTSSSSS